MGDVELKPCLFCGGEATIRTQINDYVSSCVRPYQNAWVECKKCGARGTIVSDEDSNGSHIFSVIRAWNGRVSE